MPQKNLCVFVLALFISSCVSTPTATPLPTQAPSPAPTFTPTVPPENLLAQQVKDDLINNPRPLCETGKIPGKEWEAYRLGLATALRKLFSDSRARSLSLQSLAGIFKNGSGLTLDIHEGKTDLVLASIVESNCHVRIGGGASPTAPRDTVYVLNRQGGFWLIAQVEHVLDAVWAEDHWIVLVTQTLWGNGLDFEIWHVRPLASEWKKESKFQFSQLHGDPSPRLSADGNSVTVYRQFTKPNPCNLPGDYPFPFPLFEWNYKWQNGEYRCATGRISATPVPTRRP